MIEWMIAHTDRSTPDAQVRLANRDVELIAATGFGPRILHYALIGERNVFASISPASQARETPFGDAWHIYGGHRLWHAPEDPVRTYWPDNEPVSVELAER